MEGESSMHGSNVDTSHDWFQCLSLAEQEETVAYLRLAARPGEIERVEAGAAREDGRDPRDAAPASAAGRVLRGLAVSGERVLPGLHWRGSGRRSRSP